MRTVITLFFTIVAAGLTNATAQKVFTVDYASQADVKLFVVDYASQAEWRSQQKKHLMY